eukprot:TRINITY_DN2137_c0_g1_i3.p1 TRINITY_DN2137_c0_g1~~TRINITY_DN2137_c0_g1_i3.p1  ORF type:complete len:750 (-),score=150.27 TRINITY_DN2137_c0_g1_i3:181-2430(-)
MSGAQFCNTLQELGFRDVTASRDGGRFELSSDGVEWMFDVGRGTRPLLDFMCDNLKSGNALTEEEYREYTSLVKGGQFIRDEAELTEALNSLKAFEEQESVEDIRAEVLALERELARGTRDLTSLSSRRDLLASHHASTSKKTSHRRDVLGRTTDRVSLSKQNLNECNALMDEALENVVTAVGDLIEAHSKDGRSANDSARGDGPSDDNYNSNTNNTSSEHKGTSDGNAGAGSDGSGDGRGDSSGAGGSDGGCFLSLLPFDKYLDHEDEYTEGVRELIRAQFEGSSEQKHLVSRGNGKPTWPEGRAKRRGEKGRSRLGSAPRTPRANDDMSGDDVFRDPSGVLTRLFVRGDSTEAYVDHCNEVARLQSIHPASRQERTEARVALRREEATLDAWKAQLLLHTQYKKLDPVALRRKTNEMQIKLAELERQSLRVQQQTLPPLYHDLAELQVTRILWSDYNLKLARQEYQLAKLAGVVDLLLHQRARLEYVWHTLEGEEKSHTHTHNLLLAATNQLQDMFSSHCSRKEHMASIIEGCADDSVGGSGSSGGGNGGGTLGLYAPVAVADSGAGQSLYQRRSDSPSLVEVDPVDQVTLVRLHRMLARDVGDDMNAPTYRALLDRVSALEERSTSARRRMDDHMSARTKELSSIISNSSVLHAHVYSASATAEPLLTPAALTDCQRQLEQSLKLLAQRMEEIMRNHKSKTERMCLYADDSKTDRMLFTYFFNRPEYFQRVVGAMRERVRARGLTV